MNKVVISLISLISCTILLVFPSGGYSQPFECYKPIECEGYDEAGDCITASEDTINKEPILTYLQNKWWTESELNQLWRRVHSSFILKNNNSSKCIVLIESRCRICDAHIAKANLGIVLFETTDDNLDSIYDQNNITELGKFGSSPDAYLVNIGKDNIGIAFNDGIMHQGFIVMHYVLLANVNNVYKQVLDVKTSEDASGSGYKGYNYQWDSEVAFIEGNNKMFYDIRIYSKGTKRIDKNDNYEIVPFSEEKIYKFKDDKYVLINKELL